MNRDRVYAEFAEFSRKSRVSVSEQAQRLLLLCLEAIETDPHPAWVVESKDELTGVSDEMTRRLSSFLFEIEQSRPYRNNMLTTYEVLHWLGENLDEICPIEKRYQKR